MSVKYHELVSCPDQKTPFDPAQEDWKKTDQGMETCELIGRLFHPQDVVRLCVTGAASNIHTETTVCAIEGKAENMQSSLGDLPGILTALAGRWTEELSVSLRVNPVGGNAERTGYPNAAIVIEGMDAADYKRLVMLIHTLRLPVTAILCGQRTVMFVRVNASDKAEYDSRARLLIGEMKGVDPEMEWTVKDPEETVPIPRIAKDGLFYSIYYPACGTPPVDEWSQKFFKTVVNK